MLKFASIFLAILVCATPVSAQEYTRHRLPDSVSVQIAGERHAAFDLDGYRELLDMDNDLYYLAIAHATDTVRIAHFQDAVADLVLSRDEVTAALELSEANGERLMALWTEENRLRHEAENRPDWDWIPWTLAGALAIVAVVLGLVIGVQN